MAISAFSRYSTYTVTPITDPEGDVRPTIIIEPPQHPITYNIAMYTWQMGDQIEYLAHSAYGDETQWWRIADANPEIIFWDAVPIGATIRVPNA